MLAVGAAARRLPPRGPVQRNRAPGGRGGEEGGVEEKEGAGVSPGLGVEGQGACLPESGVPRARTRTGLNLYSRDRQSALYTLYLPE